MLREIERAEARRRMADLNLGQSGPCGAEAAVDSPPAEAVPSIVFVVYENSAGEGSRRAVTLAQVWADGGVVYFRGYCHLADAVRSFRADRVQELVCLATGEVTDRPVEWLQAHALMGAADDRIATQRAIRQCKDELVLLALVGHSDGRLDPAEVEVAVDHVMMACDDDIDRDLAASVLRKLRPYPDNLADVLSRVARNDARWPVLARSMRRLILADGEIHPNEQVAWAEVQDLFARAVADRVSRQRSKDLARAIEDEAAFAEVLEAFGRC